VRRNPKQQQQQHKKKKTAAAAAETPHNKTKTKQNQKTQQLTL
jgi:hypothetical protein